MKCFDPAAQLFPASVSDHYIYYQPSITTVTQVIHRSRWGGTTFLKGCWGRGVQFSFLHPPSRKCSLLLLWGSNQWPFSDMYAERGTLSHTWVSGVRRNLDRADGVKLSSAIWDQVWDLLSLFSSDSWQLSSLLPAPLYSSTAQRLCEAPETREPEEYRRNIAARLCLFLSISPLHLCLALWALPLELETPDHWLGCTPE